MPSNNQGAIHLFRFAGVDLFLHWSWFLVAAFEIQSRSGKYTSILWNVLEYLALFLIVLLHEFGHALACKQVGGTANRIVLWPLGGVAYVDPPQRPGATLWSIAAGPLVNLALLPFLIVLFIISRRLGWAASMHDVYVFVRALLGIDISLLVFNLLPFYPLDGGQILRSLLWFFLGRARSLMVVTVLGFLGIFGFFGLAVIFHSVWTGAIAVFMLINCWNGLQQARELIRRSKLPRRSGFACPNCGTAPLLGEKWQCDQCMTHFDTFQNQAVCPHCAKQFPITRCGDCGKWYPVNEWVVGGTGGIGIVNGGIPAK
jgi:Zn-dependent protease